MNHYTIERLYQRYADRLYRFVLLRVGNVQDAQDIVSDVFLRVVRNGDQFSYRSEAELRGWLFTITRNCIFDHYRKQKPVDDIQEEDIVDQSASLHDIFDIHIQYQQVFTELQDLPERMQEIVLLRYQVGLKNKEIAKLLDIEPGTVSGTLTRARQALISSLKKSSL